jgi:pimeloyl-ACP methyl ester carboxylesterase
MSHSPSTTSGYVAVNGLHMYHEMHGDGQPLVLLHGALGTIESCFTNLLPVLARTRNVIATEFQGHGHTPDVDRPLSYQQMASDTAALLRALDIEIADFVGYSMGGAVALQIAIQHPHLVRRLVYAGGTCYDPAGIYPEALAAMTAQAPHDLDDSAWHRAYVNVAPDPDAWPALVAKVRELDRAVRAWPAADVQGIRAPTLLVIGDADLVRPEHTVQMFRLLGGGVVGDIAALPASQLAILPGTSHVGVLDRVDWLHSMINRFLDAEQSQR